MHPKRRNFLSFSCFQLSHIALIFKVLFNLNAMPLRTLFAKLSLFFVLLLTVCLQAYSQTIEYSRHTFELPEYNNLQLIANVSGFYHLLFTKKNVAPTLYIFDGEMESVGKKELPAKFIGARNIRVISFKNFYLLYFEDSTKKQELWKINGLGETYSLSNLFQNFVDSTFKIKPSRLTLINDDEQLTVIADAYYRDLKVMANTVVKVDDKFKVTSSRTFSYAFEPLERINQVMLAGNHLFILRSGRNSEEYSTDLIKADLTTGKMFRKTFNSNLNFSGNAAFLYSAADSSILIHSRLGSQIFIAKVDVSLHELVPATLLSTHFNNNVSTNFLLVDGKMQQWLAIRGSASRIGSQSNANSYTPPPVRDIVPLRSDYYRALDEMGRKDEARLLYDLDMYRYTSTGFGSYANGIYSNYNNYNNPTPNTTLPPPALRLSILDKEFKLAKDSVVTNKKNSTTLWPGPYRSITIGHKSCLMLKQDLPHKKRGLLLVSSDANNQISAKDLSVLGNYDYLLQCAQIKDAVMVIPYLEKSQVGLIKLSFSDF
jgi:hypothetical protein